LANPLLFVNPFAPPSGKTFSAPGHIKIDFIPPIPLLPYHDASTPRLLLRVILAFPSSMNNPQPALSAALSGLIPNTGGQLTLSYDFTASSSTPTLSIANLGIGADTSLLFDNISLRAIPEPAASLLLLASTGLVLRRSRRKGAR
jgi:hypothetical protein